MWSRKRNAWRVVCVLALGFGVALEFLPLASGQEKSRQFYVVNTKPSSVSILDAASLKVLGTIPLDPNPSYVRVHPQGRFLYVLSNGRFNLGEREPDGPSELTILDLESRQPVRKVKLGWDASRMSFSKDHRYLFCFSPGRPETKKTEKEYASVTIIDTQKNDVDATLSAGRLGKQILFTSDASKIFVLSEREAGKNKKDPPLKKPALTIFALANETPLAEIELDGSPDQMVLSRDEKWIYVLDQGAPHRNPKKDRNGVVYVVDVSAAKLAASHDAGSSPRRLIADSNSDAVTFVAETSPRTPVGKVYQLRGAELAMAGDVGREPLFIRRLPGHPGNFIFSYEEMRYLPDDAPMASSYVALNPKKGEPKEEGRESLKGYPEEALCIPGQERAVLTVSPTSKVAFVNLKDNKVEKTVTTGRGSVKFAKIAGAMALSVAMTAGSYYAGQSVARASGNPYFYYNVYSFSPALPNLGLAASPDGKYVYALNSFSQDITIINTADYSVVDKVPVSGDCRRVMVTPGGKFICAYSPKQMILIDAQTNKRAVEHKIDSGKLNNVYVDEVGHRIFAMTSNAVLVWDAEKGDQVAKLDGFNEPDLMIASPEAPEE